LTDYVDKNSFHKQNQISLKINSDALYNSQPSIKLPQDMISFGYSNNYLVPFFDSNKVSIYSTRRTIVKIGDFILSKAIKKDI